MSEYHLRITGMTCSACSARIEKALKRMEGVQDAAVSLATSTAIVRADEGTVGLEPLVGAIHRLGYGAERKGPSDEQPFMEEARVWRGRFLVSAILSLPLLYAMLAHFAEPLREATPAFVFHPPYQAAVATLLVVFAGYPFFAGAVRSLARPNMDVLIALGIGFAYGYSLFQLFRGSYAHASSHASGHLHFDSIAMVATAVTFGKWMEALAKGQAIRSLTALRELSAEEAVVLRGGRGEQRIPAAFVRPGDRVKIAAGERIPADGIVEAGGGEVDESLLTGESVAPARRAGDRVYAGTTLIGGALAIKVTAKGTETRLSKLIAMAEQAQATKPRIQRQADLVGAWFVPALIALAGLTFSFWWATASADAAIGRAMAVLLVACPCALGLATPISVVVGSGLAARQGIVFKDGRALETLSRVDLFIFDKTGTLTRGRPALTDIVARGMPASRLLRIAADLERRSEHPLGRAVVREANARRLLASEATDVREYPGEGISGSTSEGRVAIGSAAWLESGGIRVPAAYAAGQAGTALHAAVDDRWVGVLTFRDRARDDAASTVRGLSRLADVVMATGDKEDAAEQIARETGIARVRARQLPESKLETVREHQRNGAVVAMVGDGANDAAAMAAADVGIMMAGGNDAAMQAGDVVLIGGKLSGVAEARRIAAATMRNIKQNLGIAVAYNAVMVPLAMAGLLDPRAACAGMASSSLLVVGNALRLRREGGAGKARGVMP